MAKKEQKYKALENEIQESASIGGALLNIASALLDEYEKIEIPDDKNKIKEIIGSACAEYGSLLALALTYTTANLEIDEEDKRCTRALSYTVVLECLKYHPDLMITSPKGTDYKATKVIEAFMDDYIDDKMIKKIKKVMNVDDPEEETDE